MSCGQQNGRTAAALVLLLCWPFAVRSAPRQDSMSTEAKRLGLNEDDYVSKYLAWGNVLVRLLARGLAGALPGTTGNSFTVNGFAVNFTARNAPHAGLEDDEWDQAFH